MDGMLIAKSTVFFDFNLAGLVLFVLCGRVIAPLTFLASQQNDISHILFLC
jgi:hypothetical protein